MKNYVKLDTRPTHLQGVILLPTDDPPPGRPDLPGDERDDASPLEDLTQIAPAKVVAPPVAARSIAGWKLGGIPVAAVSGVEHVDAILGFSSSIFRIIPA